MKGSQVVAQVVVLLHLVSVIAGNDVTTINYEDLDEENIERALEAEHLIQVVDRRNHKPISNSAVSSQDRTQQTSFQATLPSLGGAKNLNTSLSKDNWIDFRGSDLHQPKQGTAREGWTSLTGLSPLYIEEQEDEFLQLDEEGFEHSLSRHRRASTAGSGETVAKTEFGLSEKRQRRAANFNEDIAIALKSYLEDRFKNVPFQTEVTDFSGGIVKADIKYPEIVVSRLELARALYDLEVKGNLRIAGKVFLVYLVKLLTDDLSVNIFKSVICYLCESYETCKQVFYNQWTCRVDDPQFYPHGTEANDKTIPVVDEFYAEKIKLNTSFPYNNQLVDTLFVSSNGLISFKDVFSSYSPVRCPVRYSNGKERMILAPYWTDLDLLKDDKGKLFFQVYNQAAASNRRVKDILDRARQDVLLYSGERFFNPSIVFVVTWSNMIPYPAYNSDKERVTFQSVIITNGETSYVIYLYAQGALRFNPIRRRNVQVCFKNKNLDNTQENYYRFDTVIGNTNRLGRWFFQLGRVPNSRSKCFNWFESSMTYQRDINIWNRIIPRCPCSEFWARRSFQWIPSRFESGCYDIFPSFGQVGRRCCYRRDWFGSFENRMPKSGNLQLFTPYFGNAVSHELQDAAPKRWCCYESDLCYLYYLARPVQTCTSQRPWSAITFGDPHIKTLDERAFIFNGLGEYRLLEIKGQLSENVTGSENKSVNFKLQARTCRAKNSNGTLTTATVFCALAVKNTHDTGFSVEVHQSGKYMVIYINGEDYTSRFRDFPTFSENVTGIYIEKVNDSLKISTPDDVGLTINLDNDLLDFIVEIDAKYKNMAKGLLGNFNDDPSDDFIFPNGTSLPNSTNERTLFEYCQSWAVIESIFNYTSGKNSSSFSDPSFIPTFFDEINTTVLEEAKKVCGGDVNQACIFDYALTRNQQLATNTKTTILTYEDDKKKAANRPPVINGTLQVFVTVNETTKLTLTGSDPDNDTFSFILISGPNSGFNYTNTSTFLATYTPADLNIVNIAVAAQDVKGLQSEVAEVFIVTCSGCSKHGTCNFTEQRNTSNPYYSLATCDCQDGYSGDDCQDDTDGCANMPCPQDTNCTDLSPSEEIRLGRAFNCTDCPLGFYANDTKCEDDDECKSVKPCDNNSDCANTIGSYICTCKDGYRKTSAGKCMDINECVENQHECEQICTNTIGYYNCSCYPGFSLDSISGLQCRKNNIDPCQSLTHKNCSVGCMNSSGVPQCFCNTGMRLAADGVSCEDINECEENLCSQNCNNTMGSYECSCLPGYILLEDHLSCDPCSSNEFGLECKSTCNCRGHADRCDSVKGCICQEGWKGDSCEEDVDECEELANLCPIDQICSNTNGSYSCDCLTGYTDTYNNGSCFNINECDLPEGKSCVVCIDYPGSFTCACKDGYTLNTNVCEDINECLLGISGCEQECSNMEGSFNCECRSGYVLADDRKKCVKESDLDPCRNFNISCDYACEIVETGPQCYCQLGYLLGTDNKTCFDRDECTDGSHRCTSGCVNTPGSYNCSCLVGYQLQNDTRTCKICDSYQWGPDCRHICSCNSQGSSRCDHVTGCICLSGWGGSTCHEDKDECSQNNQNLCPEKSWCINTFGSYICECPKGYVLNGSLCSNINECDHRPCDQNCSDTLGSYMCSCSEGFVSVGDKCLDIDECAHPERSSCEQQCRNTQGGFMCECYEGYILNTTNRKACYRDPLAKSCGVAINCSDFCSVQNGLETCSCRPGYKLAKDNANCTNINECENSNPCTNGTCRDLVGSFACDCDHGFKISADGVTCQACNSGYYGENCTNMCTCNVTNTNKCNATDGACDCQSGWTGITCSKDIDECSGTSKIDCGTNARCENTPGSFHCICEIGFIRTSSKKCIPCDDTHFGQDCLNNCSCVTANTLTCDDVNGTCTCKSGWDGPICDTDINECTRNSSYCPNAHDSCSNLNGSAECQCDGGYQRHTPEGDCEDINECLNPVYKNCSDTQDCRNTIGGFGCTCKTGYLNVTGQCRAITKVYQVKITLLYTETETKSFGDIFNNNTEDFRNFAQLVEESLIGYGMRYLPLVLLAVRIKNFYQGSIVADTSIYIDEKNSTNPPSDATKLVYYLIREKKLFINKKEVGVGKITIQNNTITTDTKACEILKNFEECSVNQKCVEKTDDYPICEPKEAETNNDLIIGLAVGLPLFVLLAIIVALLAFLYVRRKRQSKQESSCASVDHEAPFRNVFATRAPTKGSWGEPHQLYAPDAFSVSGTNESGNGSLIRTRQKGRPDFQDSAWYDNKAVASSGVPASGETSTETAGPTSNFSWEYMFRLLEPHKDFEIQRPYIEPTPNPTYLPKNRQSDSTA